MDRGYIIYNYYILNIIFIFYYFTDEPTGSERFGKYLVDGKPWNQIMVYLF